MQKKSGRDFLWKRLRGEERANYLRELRRRSLLSGFTSIVLSKSGGGKKGANLDDMLLLAGEGKIFCDYYQRIGKGMEEDNPKNGVG